MLSRKCVHHKNQNSIFLLITEKYNHKKTCITKMCASQNLVNHKKNYQLFSQFSSSAIFFNTISSLIIINLFIITVTNITIVTTGLTVTTVTTVPIVTTLTTVTTIIEKYQILLLNYRKSNFLTSLLQQNKQITEQHMSPWQSNIAVR